MGTTYVTLVFFDTRFEDVSNGLAWHNFDQRISHNRVVRFSTLIFFFVKPAPLLGTTASLLTVFVSTLVNQTYKNHPATLANRTDNVRFFPHTNNNCACREKINVVYLILFTANCNAHGIRKQKWTTNKPYFECKIKCIYA